ncbi:hypothetical protein PIB30_058756 [Stylosanthes scabra]|uniref:Uncharacterized protein n=2 Tax=Stylosanthes scabra TaxID=79078 RepID=A0ABU6ZIR4_9FABA|nr:hypothetical protein [Stylosanthes scabra]
MADTQGNDPRGVVREVEEAQLPHELDPLYNWVNRDVLGSPSTMTEEYLTELKESGVICGGGEEERLYRVEVPRRGERICGLNLEHPRVPHWLWVNEVMFTEFGVRIPFTSFQQRLLQRCLVAPSQFHPNAWSAIRCFELVTEFLELPQDPEGRYFKIFPVGDHPPFWLTLEGDAGRFPSYWSKDARVNYIPVSYKRLNDEQWDTADILLWLFSKQNLSPKALLGNPERSRKSVVKMAGKNKTLANLRRYMMANPQGPVILGPSGGQASSSVPEGGASSTAGGDANARPKVSSPLREEGPEPQAEIMPSSSLGKRVVDEITGAQKKPRTSEGPQCDFCPMDRSFDASAFIENNLLGPRAREALQDNDPMESIRWAEWAMLRAATIMKAIEPRLTVAAQWEHRCAKLTRDLKLLNQQKGEAEKEKQEAEAAKSKAAKSKAEKDLEDALADARGKGIELQRLRDREATLFADVEVAKKGLLAEKSRADRAEALLASAEQARQELVKLAEDSVKATEDNLKEQILLLAPDFDVSKIGAWKEVVDGVIVDLPPPEAPNVDLPPQD